MMHGFLADLILFTLVADVSIVSLNLSLLLNPVSTYQVCLTVHMSIM